MNCKEIQNLLYFYVFNELDEELNEKISEHLEYCSVCNEKLTKLLDDIEENKYVEELSAYIDNELSEEESIRIKKNIISNKQVREEYEKLSSLNNLLGTSFKKRENSVKDDYSKLIFRKMNLTDEVYGRSALPNVMGIFTVLFVGVCLMILALLGV